MILKLFSSVFIIVAAAFVSGCASNSSQAQRKLYSYPPATHHMSVIDGNSYRFTVSETVLTDSPAYDQRQDPPLPISGAIALAEEQTSQYYSEDEPWGPLSLESVRLVRFRNTEKWYYVVTFTPLAPFAVGPHKARESIAIPVLFTGEVLKGECRDGQSF